jgi:hypothetical protein
VSIPRWHSGIRLAIFALLCCNTLYYLYAGTLGKQLDAVAWLVLLTLYALEASEAGYLRGKRTAIALRAIRLVAAVGICAAAICYLVEQNALDAINTILWIAVVALLEFEVRCPQAIAQYHNWLAATAIALYTMLGLLVMAWVWRGAWLDAYDALLWLLAFATIEMDVLSKPARSAAV